MRNEKHHRGYYSVTHFCRHQSTGPALSVSFPLKSGSNQADERDPFPGAFLWKVTRVSEKGPHRTLASEEKQIGITITAQLKRFKFGPPREIE